MKAPAEHAQTWRTVLPAVLLTVCPVAFGHHSGSIFDQSTVVAIEGTIVEFNWSNPHVYIHVSSTSVTGELRQWEIETDATPILTRSGWSATSLQPGDQVVVRAYPDRNQERAHGRLISLATGEGALLTPRVSFDSRPSESATGEAAADISVLWSTPLATNQHLWRLRATTRSLTPKALAAQEAYDVTRDSPAGKCIAYPTPTFLGVPYLNQITLAEDRVTIRGELFESERVIYTDGRGHPVDGEATNQGHSIGRWEGDVLVVETTQLSEHRSALIDGAPMGTSRRIVERFSLSEDRRRLLIDFVVEDPEYLAEPFAGRMEWDYAPQFTLINIDCDPEISAKPWEG
ncbi:MAG: DUF6152 family protein [Candidatus Rariloculaceae bacterium]